MWLCVPCMHPPTYHWLCTCGRQPSTLQPPWSGTLPLRTWIQPPAPKRNTPSHTYQQNIQQAYKSFKQWNQHWCWNSIISRSPAVELITVCYTLARWRWVSVSRSGWCLATRRITSSNMRFFLYMVMARSGCFTVANSLCTHTQTQSGHR